MIQNINMEYNEIVEDASCNGVLLEGGDDDIALKTNDFNRVSENSNQSSQMQRHDD